jgi:hypothetical protein
MVISPLAALAAPPEIGAARYSSPRSASRCSRAADHCGATVEHITNRAPGRSAALAEHDLPGLGRVDHHADPDVAVLGHVGGGQAGAATASSEGGSRFWPDVAHRHIAAARRNEPAMPRPWRPGRSGRCWWRHP